MGRGKEEGRRTDLADRDDLSVLALHLLQEGHVVPETRASHLEITSRGGWG